MKSKLARQELKQNRREAEDKIKQNSLDTLSSAMKSRHARKDFKEAQDTYWPAVHQEK